MNYETLYTNDNGTAKVRMTINGNVLEQDIDMGADASEFDTNVKNAMAIFNAELTANHAPDPYIPPLDTPVTVTSLPTIG